MKASQPKRFWEDANAKVEAEGCCRNCGQGNVYNPAQAAMDAPISEHRIERAHLVPRRFDEVRTGPRGGKFVYVDPNAICPLCSDDHRLFDAGELSLIGKLTISEMRHGIRVLGKERFRRRIGGAR